MKRLNIFCLLILSSLLLLISSTVFASDTYGVTAGTTISNVAYLSASNASDTESPSIDTTVAAIYGETTVGAFAGSSHSNTVLLGETATIIYQVQNTGNSSDSFLVELGQLQYLNGSSNWTYSIVDSSGAEQDTQFIIGPIAEDGSETFAVRITASDSVANAPNNSQAYCTVTVSAYGTSLTGEYTGDNGTVYAMNNSNVIWTDSALVSAAVFSLTKTCTGATLAGSLSNPVPGATLWYEIEYNNTGSAAGSDVFIYDAIDTASTVFDTTTAGSAAGWTVYYSTDTATAPSPVFGASGSWSTTCPADKSTITWIKWDKASVAAAENETFGYKVIIK